MSTPATVLDPLLAYEDDPIGDTVHHPYSACNQGYEAASLGHPESANPYPKMAFVGRHGITDFFEAMKAKSHNKRAMRHTNWLDGHRTWHAQQQPDWNYYDD